MIGKKDGFEIGFIQVKSCHPDRASSFILRESDEKWIHAPDNQYVVLVWLGSPKKNESPKYWIASKKEVGQACIKHPAHGQKNWERRFSVKSINPKWENDWARFDRFK